MDEQNTLENYLDRLSTSLVNQIVHAAKDRKEKYISQGRRYLVDAENPISSIYLYCAPNIDLGFSVSGAVDEKLNSLRDTLVARGAGANSDYELVDSLCRTVVHFVPFDRRNKKAYAINLGHFFNSDGSPRLKNL